MDIVNFRNHYESCPYELVSIFGGSRSFTDLLSIFTVIKRAWLLKWMAMSTTCRKRKMNGERRC